MTENSSEDEWSEANFEIPDSEGNEELSHEEKRIEAIRQGHADYDWLTPVDKEILGVMATGLILTPSVISENIGRASGSVSRRLKTLLDESLIKKESRGKYHISNIGMAYADYLKKKEHYRRRYDR
ncbi:helix-turn-helix domain-containing protein [Halosegnis longus]|uniref:helix-turn-helix domain-containing protein n=1 Tax=Halosegnis longus TaxID=2216012 RepID=UPI0009ADA532|nr:helix-turn-helix domain-containing protein [Salella cibi]